MKIPQIVFKEEYSSPAARIAETTHISMLCSSEPTPQGDGGIDDFEDGGNLF